MWPVPAVQFVGTAQRDVDRKKNSEEMEQGFSGGLGLGQKCLPGI